MLLFYSAASLIEIRKWNPQASDLAQPPGSGTEVEPAGFGSGAKVQSPATLLWGLTPAHNIPYFQNFAPNLSNYVVFPILMPPISGII